MSHMHFRLNVEWMLSIRLMPLTETIHNLFVFIHLKPKNVSFDKVWKCLMLVRERFTKVAEANGFRYSIQVAASWYIQNVQHLFFFFSPFLFRLPKWKSWIWCFYQVLYYDWITIAIFVSNSIPWLIPFNLTKWDVLFNTRKWNWLFSKFNI